MRFYLATRDILRIFTMLEHVSAGIKIKVMSIQDKIDFLKSQLTGDFGSNDKILIAINGLMIEQHKQDTLNRILK